MPMNGEINDRFGVYTSLCCGAEIVIAEGAGFPDCPRHRGLSTTWKSTVDKPILHARDLWDAKRDSAA
jgi:hypothetical protein